MGLDSEWVKRNAVNEGEFQNFCGGLCSRYLQRNGSFDLAEKRRGLGDGRDPQIQLEGGISRVCSAGRQAMATTTIYRPVTADEVFHILRAETMGCALSAVTVPGFLS